MVLGPWIHDTSHQRLDIERCPPGFHTSAKGTRNAGNTLRSASKVMIDLGGGVTRLLTIQSDTVYNAVLVGFRGRAQPAFAPR